MCRFYHYLEFIYEIVSVTFNYKFKQGNKNHMCSVVKETLLENRRFN